MDARCELPGTSDRAVESYLNTRIRLGGFFETAMNYVDGPATDGQASTSSTILGFNVGAEFNEDLRFVSQFWNFLSLPLQNAHNDPRATSDRGFGTYTFGTLITQGYVEWSASDAISVEGGMGYSPYGITFQQLEPVLFVRRSGPQILRANNLLFPFWQGVHAHGSFRLESGRWGYHAYTFSPQDSARVPGFGTRFWWRSPTDSVSAGLSTQSARRNGRGQTTVGPDARIRLGDFIVTTELARSVGSGKQPWTFHVEPDLYLFEQSIVLYVFADYLSNAYNQTTLGTASVTDPIRKWEYGTGVNWLPTSYTRLRLGITLSEYVGSNDEPSGVDRDFWMLDLSAGVAF